MSRSTTQEPKYRREGECVHCGACCIDCPAKALRVLKNGESRCSEYGVGTYYLAGCNVWPSKPEHIADKPLCGYRFVVVNDGD